MSPLGIIIFGAVMALGLFFTAYMIFNDVEAAGGAKPSGILPYLLLAVALLVAPRLRVRQRFPRYGQCGRHRDLHAGAAAAGRRGLVGVLQLSRRVAVDGLVAYNIVSLLPIDLILAITSSAGFAMVFSMLIAAIIWNLGTWWLGLPASSSHTLIGSIIGVGVMNAILHGHSASSA